MATRLYALKSQMSLTLLGLFVSFNVPEISMNQAFAQAKLQLSAEQTKVLQEAKQLSQKVDILYRQGKLEQAIPLAEQILKIQKSILGENNSHVATSLFLLGELYDEQNRYREAEHFYRQALKLREQLLEEKAPELAVSIEKLAKVHWRLRRYPEAEALFKRVLELDKKWRNNQEEVAISLNNLAILHHSQGRFSDAKSLLHQTLTLRRSLFGNTDLRVAVTLMNIAGVLQSENEEVEAEKLYLEALKIYKTSKQEDQNYALLLDNLSELYVHQQRYQEAEPLKKQSLEKLRQQFGEISPDFAIGLSNFAWFYVDLGRYSEAISLIEKLSAIEKQLWGDPSLEFSDSIKLLGTVFIRSGNYDKAEQVFLKALKNSKKGSEELFRNSIGITGDLAFVYYNQGRYAEAEKLYLQVLEMRKKLDNKASSDSTLINNLALLYFSQGRYAEAEKLYLQALEVENGTKVNHHPDSIRILVNIAFLRVAQGKIHSAVESLSRAVKLQERNVAINLNIGSDRQKLAYLKTFPGLAAAISFHLQFSPNDSTASRLAMTAILRHKARVLDSSTNNLQRLRQNLLPSDQQQLDQLAAIHTKLSALIYQNFKSTSSEQSRLELEQLEKQANQLEADLSSRNSEFRNEFQSITVEAAQTKLPENAALIEFLQYEPLSIKFNQPKDRWGKPNYAAYLLTHDGKISWVDLGDAASIDALTDQFRRALRTRNSDIKQIARQLDAALMQPIRAKLGNTKQLLISPDSQLNLIPFAALVDENNRYLVETYSITYLTSGRDLLRFQNNSLGNQALVILANPDYDKPGNPTSVTLVRQENTAKPSLQINHPSEDGTQPRSTNFANLQFGALPGTKAEAAAIAPKLPGAIVLTDSQATENALKQVQSPRILHIATHGFFLQDLPEPTLNSRSGGDCRSDICVTPIEGFQPPRPRTNTANALLRSGLALAGANPKQSGGEDGILTALEASNLNLSGTQLVILSACETGLGDVANGEGVYGLRRAFTLAGAETQLMSLWKVDDTGTKDLMIKYYDQLLNGVGRSDALLQTQRAFLQDPKYRHPYYWASFIPSGNWQPLR